MLLFWDRAATPDRAVRLAVRDVSRGNEDVFVAEAPIGDVGRYGAITRDIQVQRSPTVILLDTRTRAARTIAGYTEERELSQALDDLVGR